MFGDNGFSQACLPVNAIAGGRVRCRSARGVDRRSEEARHATQRMGCAAATASTRPRPGLEPALCRVSTRALQHVQIYQRTANLVQRSIQRESKSRGLVCARLRHDGAPSRAAPAGINARGTRCAAVGCAVRAGPSRELVRGRAPGSFASPARRGALSHQIKAREGCVPLGSTADFVIDDRARRHDRPPAPAHCGRRTRKETQGVPVPLGGSGVSLAAGGPGADGVLGARARGR
jgi:hypothetical protein